MMGYVIVLNSFQTPNNYVDTAMAMLTAEEYKCLSFATRHILGWQDKINRRRGYISLGMFENGFITSKGVQFGGTGLTRTTIIRATDELTRLLFLIKIGEPTEDGQEWELGEEPDFDALKIRYDEQKAQRQQQTAKAREAKRAGGLSNRPPSTGLSNRLEVVCSTYQRWFVQQTISGLLDRLNQIHSQNHLQKESQTSDSLSSNSIPIPSQYVEQWDIAFGQLSVQLDRSTFETYLRDVRLVAVEGQIWRFVAASQYFADFLQHRLNREIRRVLTDVLGIRHDEIELQFQAAEVVPS